MMRRTLAAALALGAATPAWAQPALFLGPAHYAAPAGACADIARAATRPTEITQASEVPAGPLALPGPPGAPPRSVALPAHCLVRGVIDRRIGVAGVAYGIHFELRLPADWNGRFLFQGGGGINGVVLPAIGSVKGPIALQRGFAVVTQDAGHSQTDASFGADSQARIDMIYRSYDIVTQTAKRLVAAYYRRAPDRSYYMGCSEGGREALLVSQRLPLDYDGVVAGDPGLLLGVSFDDVARRKALIPLAPIGPDGRPDLSRTFSPAQLALLNTAIDADCDAADGLKDGIIDDAPACRPRLERLRCAPGQNGDACLSAPQLAAIQAIFDGGLPAGHDVLTKGYYYNNQLTQGMWRGSLAGYGGLAPGGVDSVQGLFLTPYDPGFDTFAIDFAHAGPRFDEVGGLNRADAVSYSSFAGHGGKLLIYTGLADPAFSAKTLVDYYARLRAANAKVENGGAAFARLFLVPNMLHCRGGMSLDEFDPLGAAVAWVEQGQAPDRLVATGAAFPGRSRPVCAWPAISRYTGRGSSEDAANFECATP